MQSFISYSAAPQKFRVAVVGGGPSGACAADALAKNPNIECTLFERKLDNAKPCGGTSRICIKVFLLLITINLNCRVIYPFLETCILKSCFYPYSGAIPVCMVEEFNLPSSIIDRKVFIVENFDSSPFNCRKKIVNFVLTGIFL